jgi:dTMP kinase
MTFIALEGGEGCGKTTLSRMLEKSLSERFPERVFIWTREPGGTPFAEEIRSLIFNSQNGHEADTLTQFCLMMASRSDHTNRLVEPQVRTGATVISDRSVASSFTYQLYAEGSNVSKSFFDAHYNSLVIVPSLSIILDIDPRVGLERKNKQAGEALNYFDRKPLSFHDRVREGYREYAKRYPALFIDANRPIDVVHADLLEAIVEQIERTTPVQ